MRTKLVNVEITTKELIKALLGGEEFRVKNSSGQSCEGLLHFKSTDLYPFYLGKNPVDWGDVFSIYKEVELVWQDHLKDGPIWCKVWSGNRPQEVVAVNISEYSPNFSCPYKSVLGEVWEHATPIIPSEVYQGDV